MIGQQVIFSIFSRWLDLPGSDRLYNISVGVALLRRLRFSESDNTGLSKNNYKDKK